MASGDMTLTLNEQDFNNVKEALLNLSTIEKNSIVQRGLREGVQVIIDQGRINLSARNKVRTGKLKGSFTRTYKKSVGAVYAGFRRPQGAAAHLIDKGTADRWTRKGFYRGHIDKVNGINHGSRFWTDAAEQKGDEGLERLYESIRNAVDDIIANR